MGIRNKINWKKARSPEKNFFYSLLFPLILEQLLAMVLGNIDVVMLSQYSDSAVAATGLANQLINVGLMVLGVASLGSGILLMQAVGGKDSKQVVAIIQNSLFLSFLIAVVMAVLFSLCGKQLLIWIQTPPPLQAHAYQYLVLIALSLIFQAMITTLSTILRAHLMVKEAMYVAVATNIVGILGNSMVLFAPYSFLGRGIQGIAGATILARVFGMVVLGYYFYRNISKGRSEFVKIKYNKHICYLIIKLGFPSALENISYTVSQTVITGIIASFGVLIVTSKIYTQNITALVFTLAAAIAQASQIVIGRYIGSQSKEEAKTFALKVLKRAIMLGFGISVILALLSPLIVGWLSPNEEIRETVILLAYLSILLEPGRLANEIIISALNTAGDVRFPTYLSIVFTFILTIPLAYLFGRVFAWGLVGIWWVFIIDEWFRFVILLRRWRLAEWQAIDLI